VTATSLTLTSLRRAGLGSFFRPVEVERLGITEPALRRLVREGKVEKIARGLYRLAAADPSEHFTLAAVCARAPKAILCLRTALQFHGIGTRTSPEVWLAFPRGARAPTMEIARLRIVRFLGPQLVTGVEPIKIEGVPTHITNPTRTVVDCFRLPRLIDRETALEALRAVLQDRRSTPAQLLRMAEACVAPGPMRAALEILGA
jgi:predicted transcriptional regulator of viral defense system